ncbi:hypothetical protein WICMUC_000594 [Wickerhamomyces mucosus]|uniref:Regulator of free ubiquitin chains 1 n=1 Tax=Wickerhamomyces mucosus TaxID=1378264 RepID=A0A9P8TIQ5_9ASCO|nr:hypothetical protein WICMUC_000594 [Wickerhamomyces mucosus]
MLYIRFLDLLMNKIPSHPQLTKKNPVDYKKYNTLVKEALNVFSIAEEVKKILEKKIEKHQTFSRHIKEQKEQKEQEKREKLAEEKLSQEKLKEKQEAITDHEPLIENHEHIIEQPSLSTGLVGLLRRTSSNANRDAIGPYPELVKFHIEHLTRDTEDSVTSAPLVPPKVLSSVASTDLLGATKKEITANYIAVDSKPAHHHKAVPSPDSGKLLKKVFVPHELEKEFLEIARTNTEKKLETCGILCGKLSLNAFFVTTLLIPEQESTENTCQTTEEEVMFDYIDKNDLFVLGWIHTHPTQSCFLSSIDLHTHNSYQLMLPEAIALVCAPRASPNFGVFRLTDPPGVGIISKCFKGGFHPHSEANIYRNCTKASKGHTIFQEGLPFTKTDLRKTGKS